MHSVYNLFRTALFGIVLNANLVGYAAVPHQLVSNSRISSVSSVRKTPASSSVSSAKQLIASAGGSLGVLNPGQALAANQSLTSPNGQYSLVCQGDGNLVLYENSTGLAYWESQTGGKSVSQCIMQTDGNLVVYGKSGVLWSSGTSGHSAAYLQVQDDRNMVIYAANGQVLGATNTSVDNKQVIQYANNRNFYGTVSSLNFKRAITDILNKGGSIQNIAFTPTKGGFVIIYTTPSTSTPIKYNFNYYNIPQEAVDQLNQITSATNGNVTDIEFTPQGGFVILRDFSTPPYISKDISPALANEITTVYNQYNRSKTFTQILFPPQGGFVFVVDPSSSSFIFSSAVSQALRDQFSTITNLRSSVRNIAFTPQGGFVAIINGATKPFLYNYGNIPPALTAKSQEITSNMRVVAFSASNDWVLISN